MSYDDRDNNNNNTIDYWERERRKEIRKRYKHSEFNEFIISDITPQKSEAAVQTANTDSGPADAPGVGTDPIFSFIDIRAKLPYQQRETQTDRIIKQDTEHFINSRIGFKIIDEHKQTAY